VNSSIINKDAISCDVLKDLQNDQVERHLHKGSLSNFSLLVPTSIMTGSTYSTGKKTTVKFYKKNSLLHYGKRLKKKLSMAESKNN
jgi:hypothetical protein